MSSVQYTIQDFKVEAASWSSSLGDYLGDGSLCCMLHSKIDLSIDRVDGCGSWDVGTHKSIRVLYKSNVHNKICHAQIGQLVLDKHVAREARDMQLDGFGAMGLRPVFGRKYRQGYPADVRLYGAGYCYLHAFSPGTRSRVARILGPFPLVSDVLRLMRVIGDAGVSAVWQFVAPGLYHVAPVPPSTVTQVGFFKQGWDILRQYDSSVRVGGIQDIGMISCILSKFSCGLHADDDNLNEEIETLLPQSEGRVPMFETGPDAKGRAVCTVCGFNVKVLDHADRCVIRDERGDLDSFFSSWLGDVVHRRDVRFYVIKTIKEKKKMGDKEKELVSDVCQAAYYLSYRGVKVPARGTSKHSLSTAFESSYHGKFRKDYIDNVLKGLQKSDFPKHVQVFACEL